VLAVVQSRESLVVAGLIGLVGGVLVLAIAWSPWGAAWRSRARARSQSAWGDRMGDRAAGANRWFVSALAAVVLVLSVLMLVAPGVLGVEVR
jgi:hypothetical protein